MARIIFKEGESIVGTAILVALLGALIVAAIVFAWEHHQNKMNGTDGSTPSSSLYPSVQVAEPLGA
jgi:hypothetical protein